jgi:hypothetical protein
VAELIAGADFVKGSRFAKGGHSHDITPLRKWGNDGLNVVVNVLFGTKFTDLCYGYNAFWRRVVPALGLPDPALPRPADGGKLWGDGFEIESMINIRAAADGMKVGEVGSIEHARIHGASNLNTFRDGARVLRTIFSEYALMRSRRRAAARGTVLIHQNPAVTAPAAAYIPSQSGLDQVVHRPAPIASFGRVHPSDPRPHTARLNRPRRMDEIGTRRTEDVTMLRARAALDD